jgi:osmotically-inducible protein OsmY
MTMFYNLQKSSVAIRNSACGLVLKALVLSTAVAGLGGCAAVVMGGVIAGTVMVASDRRTSGAQLNDEGIEIRSSNRLKEKFGERGNFSVTSYNGRVLLTGEVAGNTDKLAAEQLVFQVENVKLVVNELTIAGSTSTLKERSNDTVITSRVKTGLIEAKELPSNAFKVVTERAVVYLMGRVTQREADMGTDIARSISGVVKVVRSFELISEEEAKQK